MASAGNFESVLRSGHEAQARRRRSPSPFAIEEVSPDEYPTFTRPISPELDETERYTTDPPKRKRTNPWSFRRDSIPSESGDDCDQPLTRLSQKASTVLHIFTPQRAHSDASGGISETSSEEPDQHSEPTTQRQHGTIARRCSSLQKIKDFITRKRKDSATSDKSMLSAPPLDADDRAVEFLIKPSAPKDSRPPFAADSELCYMTGALPSGPTELSSSDGSGTGTDVQSQTEQPKQVCCSASNSSGSGGSNSSACVNADLSPPTGEINGPIPFTNTGDNSPPSSKHNCSGICPSNDPAHFTGSQDNKPRNYIREKLIEPMPGSSAIAPFNTRTALMSRYISPSIPIPQPTSVDDIGVLPLSFMKSTSHITLPTFADPSPTANSSTVAVDTPSNNPAEQCAAPPPIDPTVFTIQPSLPSESTFAFSFPSMEASDTQPEQSPAVSVHDVTLSSSTPVTVDWPSCALLSVPVGDEHPCTSSTVPDSESTREALRPRRSSNLLNDLKEASAAVVLCEMGLDGEEDLAGLRGLEGLDGYEFARRAVRWTDESDERGGRSRVR